MDGEIIERSPDVLGKSSRKRKESLVKKKKKQSPSGRSDGGREGKRKKELQGEYVVGGMRGT